MINPVRDRESFGGLTQEYGLIDTKRDASNTQAPRTATDPAVRPAEGCSNRFVVLSDASITHAPCTTFAMANDDGQDAGQFDARPVAATLSCCATNRDSSRGFDRNCFDMTDPLLGSRIQVAPSMTDTTRRAAVTRSTWRPRHGAPVPASPPAARPAGLLVAFGLPAATTSLGPSGLPLVTLVPPSATLELPQLEQVSLFELDRRRDIRPSPLATSANLTTQIASWVAQIHWGGTPGDDSGGDCREPNPAETLDNALLDLPSATALHETTGDAAGALQIA